MCLLAVILAAQRRVNENRESREPRVRRSIASQYAVRNESMKKWQSFPAALSCSRRFVFRQRQPLSL